MCSMLRYCPIISYFVFIFRRGWCFIFLHRFPSWRLHNKEVKNDTIVDYPVDNRGLCRCSCSNGGTDVSGM